MVLKVVRGKILETLELTWQSGRLRLRSRDNRKAPGEGFRLRLVGPTQQLAMGQRLRPSQVVKERGYLLDNLCCSIISVAGNEIKGKGDGR